MAEMSRRVAVAGVAVVLVTATAVVGVVLLRDSGHPATDVAAGPAATRLYLVPSGLDPGLQLAYRSIDEQRGTGAPDLLRLFARLGPDGVTPVASLAVLVSGGPLRDPRATEVGRAPVATEMLEVDGQAVAVFRESSIRSSVSFRAASGRAVAVIVDRTDDTELAAAAASLRTADPSTATPDLPAGFEAVYAGPSPQSPGPPRALRQDWRDSRLGRSFTLTVQDGPAASLAPLAWSAVEGRLTPVTVRGHRGILTGIGALPTLAWMERPDTLVTIAGSGLDATGVQAVADGLRAVDEAAWMAMTPSSTAVSAPARLVSGEQGGVTWEASASIVPSAGLGIPVTACLTIAGVTPPCPVVAGSAVPAPGTVFLSLDVRPSADGRALFVTAAVRRDVARASVALADGSTVEALPVGGGADLPVSFIVLPLPPGARPDTVTAFDASGRELGRAPISSPPGHRALTRP